MSGWVDRVQRLKDARTEAAKEIDDLRSKKQAELAQMEQGNSGSNDQIAKKLDGDTEKNLANLRSQFETNKQVAVQRLVETVMKVA